MPLSSLTSTSFSLREQILYNVSSLMSLRSVVFSSSPKKNKPPSPFHPGPVRSPQLSTLAIRSKSSLSLMPSRGTKRLQNFTDSSILYNS